MSARAALATERSTDRFGRPADRLSVLRSQAPLMLRPTNPKGKEPFTRRAARVARVSLASGAAGPLGGDDFTLSISVGSGSTLVLTEVSATLLLPGATGGQSRMRIDVAVEDDAVFLWLAEPVIAAAGCDHLHDITVDLAAHARFLMRDELLLGRHREQPGNITQRIRVRRAGRSLFQQQLTLGPAAKGWDSAAVVGRHKSVGTVIVVDPEWSDGAPPARVLGNDAALLPLAGPGVVISAMANSTLSVRRTLERGVALLGEPWAPDAADAATAAHAETVQREQSESPANVGITT